MAETNESSPRMASPVQPDLNVHGESLGVTSTAETMQDTFIDDIDSSVPGDEPSKIAIEGNEPPVTPSNFRDRQCTFESKEQQHAPPSKKHCGEASQSSEQHLSAFPAPPAADAFLQSQTVNVSNALCDQMEAELNHEILQAGGNLNQTAAAADGDHANTSHEQSTHDQRVAKLEDSISGGIKA